MDKLFIITNESIFNYKEEFFCDNIDLKSTPEGLNNNFVVNIIGRKSKYVRSHKINVKKIKIFSNIISFSIDLCVSFCVFSGLLGPCKIPSTLKQLVIPPRANIRPGP